MNERDIAMAWWNDKATVAERRAAIVNGYRAASMPPPPTEEPDDLRGVIAQAWRDMNGVAFVSGERPHGNLRDVGNGDTETTYAGNFLATLWSMGYELRSVPAPLQSQGIAAQQGDSLARTLPALDAETLLDIIGRYRIARDIEEVTALRLRIEAALRPVPAPTQPALERELFDAADALYGRLSRMVNGDTMRDDIERLGTAVEALRDAV